MQYFTKEDILELHTTLIEQTGGSHGNAIWERWNQLLPNLP